MATTIYTVGHGTRTTDELAGIVKAGNVATIVDVRRFPGSKRNPHLAREALDESLPARGVGYEWWGEELGGRRSRTSDVSRHAAWRNSAFRAYADYMETGVFRAAVDGLIDRARAGEGLAVMCAETLWWHCHRRLIADALIARKIQVVHLLDTKSTHTHSLHESARVERDGTIVYDVGVDRELL
jgi:uncharacterized protein (DUF488 family)